MDSVSRKKKRPGRWGWFDMKRKIGIWCALGAVVVLAAAWFVWRGFRESPRELVLYGNVDDRQVNLAFQIPERIAEICLEEGETVRKGMLLGRLETLRLKNDLAAAEAALASAEAVLEKAKNGPRKEEIQMARAELAAVEAKCRTAEIDYHRQTRLRETQAVAAQKQESAESNYFLLKALLEREKSNLAMLLAGTRKEEIAQAEADVRAARAKVKIQKQALIDAELFSPCDGVLRKRLLEIGEMANPQTPAFAIAMSSPKWVRTWLPESLLTRVRVGERALVLFDGADQPFEGWVGFVSPTAEFTPKNVETVELRTSLVYEVRIYVKDPRNLLKLGAPATVRFPGIPAL